MASANSPAIGTDYFDPGNWLVVGIRHLTHTYNWSSTAHLDAIMIQIAWLDFLAYFPVSWGVVPSRCFC